MARRFTRYFLLIGLMSVLLFGIFQAASAAETIKVVKDGKALSFDTAPQIVDGRTMVPFRGIAESLGGKVAWDEITKTVTVTKGNTEVKLVVGSKTWLITQIISIKNETFLAKLTKFDAQAKMKMGICPHANWTRFIG